MKVAVIILITLTSLFLTVSCLSNDEKTEPVNAVLKISVNGRMEENGNAYAVIMVDDGFMDAIRISGVNMETERFISLPSLSSVLSVYFMVPEEGIKMNAQTKVPDCVNVSASLTTDTGYESSFSGKVMPVSLADEDVFPLDPDFTLSPASGRKAGGRSVSRLKAQDGDSGDASHNLMRIIRRSSASESVIRNMVNSEKLASIIMRIIR
ncbi:MAG: hypothetical protein ACI4NM_00815 [Bullifex sp.]